jgi:hypothetical protein
MKVESQTFEVRAMPLIVLAVSALLLLWAWAGAFLLLNPDAVEPGIRWAGLPMLLLFGGLFLASLVTLFNTRVSVDPEGITILLPYRGSIPYGQDELDLSIKHGIMRLRPAADVKLGWRRVVTPDRWINTYLVIQRKERSAVTSTSNNRYNAVT